MVKVEVNRFGQIGCLVTRAAFNSRKVNIVAINFPCIDLNYMVYMFHYDSTMFTDKVKTENRNLSSMGSPLSSSRTEIPPISNGEMLVSDMLWSP
ncbi:LOW QUALITY PROTEIN: Glyceraldehyde-3-phosphate dehydrogenase, partial [Galemys pyrenaicus]